MAIHYIFASTMVSIIINFLLLQIFVTFCASYDLIVETNYGKIGGVLKRTRNNGCYLSFAGIPFAKPPVGDLRFANPEKPECWCGVLNGSKPSPRCIQRNYLFYTNPPIEGSEDCLYLNVYVPLKNFTNKLPVMISIPWGAFIVEEGDDGYFGPSYLLDQDVILVSVNYRVGVFGFLSTLDDEAPGNLAFKDQILAFQWVQENIKYFGGASENVTIMGQSAGAVSVHLHMLSPASQGLFCKAISESGNALVPVATPLNAIQKTASSTQAQLVGCSDVANSKELIECLRNVSAEDIMLSQDAFKTFYQFPYLTFSLVTENATERNPNPFLTKTPREYLEAGEFARVPWLTGTVKNEGLLVVSALLGPEQERTDLNSSFSSIVPSLLDLSLITNDTEGLYEKIVHQYLGDKEYIDNDEEWEQGFINLWSDWYFMYSAYQSVSLQALQGHDLIYVYSFEYAGEYTYAVLWSNGSGLYNPNWRISHCDDLLYLFKSPDLFKKQLTSETDQELSSIMIKLWVNFATYGNPNPEENLAVPNVNWEPLPVNDPSVFAENEIKFLNITGTCMSGAAFNITQGFNRERITFWEENTAN